MKKIMKEKNEVVGDEVLRKELVRELKREGDVRKFVKELDGEVVEKMVEGEMEGDLGYEKNCVRGKNRGK